MSHIDPGLDEPAKEAVQDLEHHDEEAAEKQAKAEEEDYLDPSRWWMASTAAPLIAGTFGPIANAFSICALVVKWRVEMPPGVDEGHGYPIEDPKWLIAINSISLVFALVANLALLLNMARRLSFAIAQPITIIGWYLASFLLIALVAACSTDVFRIQPRQQHALSQAYYYGIIAAGVYFIIASLMVTTVYGAYKGHYPKEFRLTPSQRTLMLQTISFMFYLLLGALIYSRIEGWRYLDAVFWANFTLLTIGIGGEFTPKTHTGRSLLFPFAIGGIVMVGLIVGSVRSLVLERGKQKLSSRLMETTRENAISSVEVNNKDRTVKLGPFQKIKFSEDGLAETERREQEFKIMRKIQAKADRKRRYVALTMSSIAALLLWFLGALVFMFSEKPQGWSYFVSLYFAYTSLLTIGYGDYTPNSNASKPFFVFWTLLAVPTLTILISNMGDTVIKAFKDITIWVGSVTVLPDEGSLAERLKTGFRRLKKGKLSPDDQRGPSATTEDAMLQRLSEHIEEEELGEAEEAGEHGNSVERDIHFYHYVLAREIRKLMKDTEVSPPKQYTYNEWSYYLRLIGEDENDTARHKMPTVEKEKHRHDPTLGTAYGAEHKESWSWLGIRSPLMGNDTEAQWLLQRLCTTLELEMRKMRTPNAKERKDPPPISMADLRKRRKSSESTASPEELLQQDLNPAEVRRRQHGGG